MNKKVVQVDNYDEVELWAGGILQMKLKFEDGKLINLISGPMSLASISEIITSNPMFIVDTTKINLEELRRLPSGKYLHISEPGIITALKEEGLSDEQDS